MQKKKRLPQQRNPLSKSWEVCERLSSGKNSFGNTKPWQNYIFQYISSDFHGPALQILTICLTWLRYFQSIQNQHKYVLFHGGWIQTTWAWEPKQTMSRSRNQTLPPYSRLSLRLCAYLKHTKSYAFDTPIYRIVHIYICIYVYNNF